MEHHLQIKTADGVADAWFFHPEGEGPWPAVLAYMDAPGIRPQLRALIDSVAAKGYAVLLPNLFYRNGPPGTLDMAKDPDRVRAEIGRLSHATIAQDSIAYLDALEAEPHAHTERMGAIGFCMGGGMALTLAGNYPDRIAAAVSLHGGRLATDAPDSPHRLAHRMTAQIYVGVANNDNEREPFEMPRLRGALEGAAVRHAVDLYGDCDHGWTVPGNRAYNEAGSRRAFEKVFGLFAETL
jgi:carboxymethylenebutenolidase